MNIFRPKKKIFTKTEEKSIVAALVAAEKETSGELRVHVEATAIENIKHRALMVFESLGMHNTEARNGVLIYLNTQGKQFLILGDEGIHAKVGQNFWEESSQQMGDLFAKNEFAKGVIQGIESIALQLKNHFPYDGKTDTNELDDEISYQV